MNAPYLGGCALHDPLAVAVAIDPTLVGALGCNLRVDLLGGSRGRTICDEHCLSDPDKSALVALTVDAPRFLSVQGAHGPHPRLGSDRTPICSMWPLAGRHLPFASPMVPGAGRAL